LKKIFVQLSGVVFFGGGVERNRRKSSFGNAKEIFKDSGRTFEISSIISPEDNLNLLCVFLNQEIKYF